MARSVRISVRAAQALLTLCADAPTFAGERVVAELRAALAPKKFIKAARKERTKKKKEHRDETSEVYAAVMKRAERSCEYCCGPDTFAAPLEMDHMFGRVRAKQSERNCWALCRWCHKHKTNSPEPWFWFEAFAKHADELGFRGEAARARGDAAWSKAKAEALALSRGRDGVSHG